MTENHLGFGYNDGLLPGLKAAWGARLIVTQDGLVDHVWDRQDAFGSDARRSALNDWLCGGALTEMKNSVSRRLREFTINTREEQPLILFQDRQGAIVGNTNASAGYLYVAGYLYDDLPDDCKTLGLDRVIELLAQKRRAAKEQNGEE